MEKTNRPLVSIGVPTYNRPVGLRNILNLLTKQTYDNIEIIVSDNCSENEEVEKVALEFSSKDSRIKYFRQTENIGMYDNFSFVLKEAKGDYFMWASDDDEFLPEFIEKCLPVLESNPKIVLCSPVCRVFANGEEVMKFKPDFHTVGLSTIERMKKIAFYIKKGHGALYGLYRRKDLQKITLRTYIDCDGLLLLELSQHGEFYMLPEELMIAQQGITNKEQKSLTYQKKKLIEYYKMKPKWLLLRYEHFTLFFYFLFQSFKWKNLNLFERLRIVSFLYRSFWGYNTSRVLSPFRNLIFFFKKKKIAAQFCATPENLPNANSITEVCSKVDKVVINISHRSYSESQRVDKEVFNYLYQLEKNEPEKIVIYDGMFSTKFAQHQYGLDFIRCNVPSITHFLVIENTDANLNDKIDYLNSKIQKWKYFNRGLKLTNEDFDLFLIPIRKYISFNSESQITAGTITL